MEKFDFQKHLNLWQRLPFSSISLPSYLDYLGYVLNKNDENILAWEDPISHEFPFVFLPHKEINWEYAEIAMASEKDIKRLRDARIEIVVKNPTQVEYFYQTSDFLRKSGSFGQNVRKFERSHPFLIKNTYQKKLVEEFFHSDAMQREPNVETEVFMKESEGYFEHQLANLKKYFIKQVYVEIDGRLVGFAWGEPHGKESWAGTYIKADNQYKGLVRFLIFKLAEKFKEREFASLGTGCSDEGIMAFKDSLKPMAKKQYYYCVTGDKK